MIKRAGINSALRCDPYGEEAPEWGAFRPGAVTRWLMARARDEKRSTQQRRIAANILRNATVLSSNVYDIEWNGLRLRLCPASNSDDNWLLRCGRHPEQRDLDWMAARYRGQNLVFADVGANIGIHTLFMARVLAPDSPLLAFEPHPKTVRQLQANLRMNKATHVRVVNAAVGDTEGEGLLFELKRSNAGQNTLLGAPDHAGESVRVPVRRLDHVLQEQGIERLDVIKIDVEGAEDRVLTPVLQHAPRSLWPGHVMLEVDKRVLWADDIEARLRDAGYVLEFENDRNRHYLMQGGRG